MTPKSNLLTESLQNFPLWAGPHRQPNPLYWKIILKDSDLGHKTLSNYILIGPASESTVSQLLQIVFPFNSL